MPRQKRAKLLDSNVATDPWVCDACGKRLKIGDWNFCPHGSVLRSKPFKKFTIDIAGRPQTISSLYEVRKIESDSLKAYGDGRGQPLVFRAFSEGHDGKHYDRNLLGGSPQILPRALPGYGERIRPGPRR